MINKLTKKISFIILCAITIPLLIVVIFYSVSYYNNVIRSNSMFIDRFIDRPMGEPNDKKNDNFDLINMDGIYYISISNGKIISSSDDISDEVRNYALKVSKNNMQYGIIGNYIYNKRMRKMIDDSTTIVFIESSNEIKKLNIVILSTIVITGIGIILIYILSTKISKMIVKPVRDTFSKQTEFISDASHELKTPLAVIQANADVLEGEIGENKWLSYIQNETDNMGKLINEMLLLTKIENVDKLRAPERFNLSDHIRLIVSSFESMAFEKKVKIDNNIQDGIVIDKFNKDDITHILSTLIDNAIKHTEEKRKVIVEFIKNKDNIEINVKNKGNEIPLDEREKIFDRFYRIDKSRNRNEKRYGLGLAIAKSTVIKNNGTIKVDYKDGYTIFSVKLPL